MTRAEARALRAAQAAGGGSTGREAAATDGARPASSARASAPGGAASDGAAALPAWPAEPPPVRDLPASTSSFPAVDAPTVTQHVAEGTDEPHAAGVRTALDQAQTARFEQVPATREPAHTSQPATVVSPIVPAAELAHHDSVPAAASSSTTGDMDDNDDALASTILTPLGVVDPSAADAGAAAGASGRKRKPRRKVTVTGVIGELLITFGVVVLLYVAWQLWIGDWIYSSQHNAEGAAVSQQWQADFEAGNIEVPEPVKDPETETWVPPVIPEPGDTEKFAQMRIPRFGADYSVPMAGGVTRSGTLDPIGIGHYPGTAMPGEVGNFALAAHRTTWGKPFNLIADLRLDDPIVVETQDGWYTYRFRTLEYVTPDQVDVLLSVPQAPDVPPGGKYITLTSCSPMYSLAERIVAYGVFDSFQPRAEGPPAWIKEGAS